MKRTLWLVALGIVAFALFALATLPARVVVDPLAARGVTVSGVTGTVWKGTAQVVQAGAVNVGAVQWDLHALPLLTGRAVADVKITRADGFVQTTLSAAPGGRIALSDLNATLPLSALPPSVAPRGWNGQLNAKLATLVILNGWPANATGTVEVLDLVGPPRKPAAMGSYKLTFPEQSPPDVLAGAITDINGPLQVAATLELKAADRSYVINGLVSTRGNASPELAKAVQFLGAPDAQGQRPVSLAGTL
ncbi:MAG: type II secretion system protein N [Steroidobacteraceae bacterium]